MVSPTQSANLLTSIFCLVNITVAWPYRQSRHILRFIIFITLESLPTTPCTFSSSVLQYIWKILLFHRMEFRSIIFC